MEVIIMRNTTQLAVGKNYMAVPRIGETLEMRGTKVKVKDVIWHIENTTWVEIQV